ncbi:hemerythrin domain-containing protein [Streptomyces sp. SAJ15]|uniref:hemerythrin domain-containing protein n=1 Tax=Streptomyces sp. SAJ15 TaxID=2011095 RepID=UPI001642C7FB|nr:hemerythrin domain-containing protein [Streptomyces sp. SAJ15]
MSTKAAPRAQSHRKRASLLYALHDAFRREAALLVSSAGVADPTVLGPDWKLFRRYLSIHHTAEDVALWPALRYKPGVGHRNLTTLAAMEAEHADLQPLMESIDEALTGERPTRLPECAADFCTALLAHLDHEEEAALPLALAMADEWEWRVFEQVQRRLLGPEGAATFLPWLLDGAPRHTRREVLGLLSPVTRLKFQTLWRPRYERKNRWQLPDTE